MPTLDLIGESAATSQASAYFGVSLVGATSGNSLTGSGTTSLVTSFTINKPTGTQQGDLMVLTLYLSGNGVTHTITPPSGWARLGSDYLYNQGHIAVFTKVAGGSEPASYTFSYTPSAVYMATLVAARGEDLTAFFADSDVASAGNGTTGGNVLTLPSMDAPAPGGLLIGAWQYRNTTSATDATLSGVPGASTGTAAGTGGTDSANTTLRRYRWYTFAEAIPASGATGSRTGNWTAATGTVGVLGVLIRSLANRTSLNGSAASSGGSNANPNLRQRLTSSAAAVGSSSSTIVAIDTFTSANLIGEASAVGLAEAGLALAVPPTVSPAFVAAWQSGSYLGEAGQIVAADTASGVEIVGGAPLAAPAVGVQIRLGRFNRKYAFWPWGDVDADIGNTPKDHPWQATWTPWTQWVDVPNISQVDLEKTFDSNGLPQATITIENVISEEIAGGGHVFKRGYLAPLRGYVAPGRTQLRDELYDDVPIGEQPAHLVTPNSWYKLLRRNAQIRVFEAYGTEIVKTFVGFVDDVDTAAVPDRVTLVARGGKILAEERVFGWSKDKSIRDPITFIDKDQADDITKVGSGALASSVTPDFPASNVVDGDSDTAWRSDTRAVPAATEWVEIKVPQGRYSDVLVGPEFAGQDLYISVKPTTLANGHAPKLDGDPVTAGAWTSAVVTTVDGSGDWTGSRAINDNATVEAPIVVVGSGVVSNVEVSTYLTHTYLGDLTVSIVHPDGTAVVLYDQTLAEKDDFGSGSSFGSRTRWKDSAPTTLPAPGDLPPYEGVYQPVSPLSALNGKPIAGTWKLRVTDHAGGDTGTLLAAGVRVNPVSTPSGGNVPDTGTPYLTFINNASGSTVTRSLSGEFVMGADSIVRVSVRNLHKVSGAAPIEAYAACLRVVTARKRVLTADARRYKWIRVGDVADIVKCVLRWAGFKEWEIETTGVKLGKRLVVNRGMTHMDVINACKDATGYEFFIADPTNDDRSLGVPVFRKPRVVTNDPPLAIVRDTDLLTGIQAREADEPLAYLIRVRGREARQGVTLGADRTKRLMYAFRPPWSGQVGTEQWHTNGGMITRVIHTDNLLSTQDDVKFGCYYIALAEAIASAGAVIQIPALPLLDLDSHVELMDLATGTTSRLYIRERRSSFVAGESAKWTMSLAGALSDAENVQSMVAIINAAKRDA